MVFTQNTVFFLLLFLTIFYVAAAGFFKYLSLLSTSPIGGGVQAVLNKLKYSTNGDGLNKLKK
jgi:hypothetical protein